MGCVQSAPGSDEDKRLAKGLKDDAKKDRQIKKLLFLGSGGSGKSTLFKQLRTIHGQGFTKDDRCTFIDHIHAQIIEQMKLAIDCIEGMAEENAEDDDGKVDDDNFNSLGVLSSDGQSSATLVQSVKDPKLNDKIATAIKTLWNEASIQEVYQNRAIMKLEDSCKYFWDKIDAVMDKDYVPDETDILLVRYRTTGVIDQKFTLKKNIFHVFDVGGQKSERKKWINCFDSVTAVIFVVSLSCYDEVMFEDEQINSMFDSIELFEKMCNERAFEKTSMILFLNKKDLFAKKLNDGKHITLCPSFADYGGDQDNFDETTAHIKEVFVKQNKTPEAKSVFTHLTCATDQGNVQKVFNDVQHIIIENSLMSAGLMGDFNEQEE